VIELQCGISLRNRQVLLSRTSRDRPPTAFPGTLRRAEWRKLVTGVGHSPRRSCPATVRSLRNARGETQRVEKLESEDRPCASSGRSPEGAGGPPAARIVKLLTTKSAEQSQNVYENKGQVQTVAESKSGIVRIPRHVLGQYCLTADMLSYMLRTIAHPSAQGSDSQSSRACLVHSRVSKRTQIFNRSYLSPSRLEGNGLGLT